MKFWSTSETSTLPETGNKIADEEKAKEYSLIFRFISNTIEKEINFHLKNISITDKYETWAVIYVCMSDEFLEFFSETFASRRKPEKVMEIRLRMDYKEFVAADILGRMRCMTNVLRRSIDAMAMPKFKIPEADRSKLHQVVNTVEKALEVQLLSPGFSIASLK